VRRQVVRPHPAGEPDRVELTQPRRHIGQRAAVAHQQPGLDLGKGVLRLGDDGGQERGDDHLARVEAALEDRHDGGHVAVLLELHVQPDPVLAHREDLGQQRRPGPGGGLDLVAAEAAHRRGAHDGVVEGDQLAVAGRADVELDHVGADVDRVRERLDGVLRGAGRDPAVRGHQSTGHDGQYAGR
jgi:hypothetical protein